MPVYTSEALILRTYKLGDADRIVVFLTRDRGKKRGVAKGARRPRSRYVGALEPMTRAGVAYYEREHRDLVRINYVEPQRSPLSGLSATSSGALGHVGYFAELIDEWAPEAHVDERLYRLGSSAVDALANGAPIDALARYFEYWILRLQGVYPSFDCAACGAALMENASKREVSPEPGRSGAGPEARRGATMPPREHVLLCRDCAPAGGSPLSPPAMHFLAAASRIAPDRLEAAALSDRASQELETVHRRLLNVHLDKELKSVRVLREMRHAR
jgi:DNA repair protein RecO (recombination protein O)